MAGLSGPQRVAVWVVALVAGAAAVGLIGVAVLVDLDTGDRTASIVGAVVSLAGLAVSVVALVRTSSSAGSGGRRVRAGRGGVAAGGDVIGNAIGDGSEVVGRLNPPAPGGRRGLAADVEAGRDGVAAAGDVRDNAIGDNSERR
ncbi:hypothetical protein Snoj_35750 [Streptomyces nojiriensis]|uniref:Uncharacterized protein n=1 Tax=Streptomyces nojiriensis TaxID=66374 RepID=A0ABQ3SNE4_9ACTN|nr:hypothetical protein [Streptomyces nojiriensis]QTI43214.1 hypothetical protein JYK04_00976 [Streptomyces nojiriensis]GGS31110.1 hypothetical protein GCM10010205_71670 [Streptomyces nojiriensis]GHI69657.1 hypothetical protein Snoj_35750 [Streptomyces nojiriensis]